MNLSECKVGDVVSFIYHSGSNPGGSRTVRVTEVFPRGGANRRIIGIDEDKDELRSFLDRHATNVSIVKPKKLVEARIRFDEAQKLIADRICRLNSNELTELYAKLADFDNATFDSATGEIVTKVVAKPKHCVDFDTRGVLIKVINVNGDEAFFVVYRDGRLFVGTDNVTIEEFSEKLAEHLDSSL